MIDDEMDRTLEEILELHGLADRRRSAGWPAACLLAAATVVLLVLVLLIVAGCSNNYIEWRKWDKDGRLVAEYKAGRQSLLVNSSWDVAAVRLDPNDVSMQGEQIASDPEQVKIVTPWGVVEGGDADNAVIPSPRNAEKPSSFAGERPKALDPAPMYP